MAVVTVLPAVVAAATVMLVVLVLLVLVLMWVVKDRKVGRCERGGCVCALYSVGNARLVVWYSPSPC